MYKETEKDTQSQKAAWTKSICDELDREPKPPQIVVFYLQPFEEKFYPEIKRLLINRFGIVSQVVTAQVFEKNNATLSIATGVIVQMNQKVGKTAWKVLRNHC
jgi:hypothetical protein